MSLSNIERWLAENGLPLTAPSPETVIEEERHETWSEVDEDVDVGLPLTEVEGALQSAQVADRLGNPALAKRYRDEAEWLRAGQATTPRASGGGYENAPATRMLATHCAACARPLVDARSVEVGMGPDCRRRHGYSAAMDAATEAERQRANRLVYQVALDQQGPGVVRAAEELRSIGFGRLADRILERCVTVRISDWDGGHYLAVESPFSEEAVMLFRGIPGRRFEKVERGGKVVAKVNLVPVGERRTLWQVLERAFPGAVGLGPKGPFVVPGAAREAA